MSNKNTLKSLMQSFYDAQKLRIQTGNRLVANIRVRLGQEPGRPTEELNEQGKQLLGEALQQYKRVTDGLSTNRFQEKVKAIAVSDGIMADVYEYELCRFYAKHLESEESMGSSIAKMVETFPIWDSFLKGVRGCGPLMAAVCISELDPHKAKYASSFWKYAGLDVGPDGRGRSKRSEHLIKVTYTTRKGEEAERLSITYNPFLKTKLMGVLGTSFLRSASPYRAIYDGYKHRLENHETYKDVSKGHRHNMSMRYMVKLFLRDLWVAMREVEGLPVYSGYDEAKLGLVHGVDLGLVACGEACSLK